MSLGYIILHPDANKFSTGHGGDNKVALHEVGRVLQEDGINVPCGIEHLLVDSKFPLMEIQEYLTMAGTKGEHSPIMDDFRDFQDYLHLHDPKAFRYRTVIRYGDDITQGSVLGYPEMDREFMVRYMIQHYLSKLELNAPFLILTNPESQEVIRTISTSLNLNLQTIG